MAQPIPEDMVGLVESVVNAIFDEACRRMAGAPAAPTRLDPPSSGPAQFEENVYYLDDLRERRRLGVSR